MTLKELIKDERFTGAPLDKRLEHIDKFYAPHVEREGERMEYERELAKGGYRYKVMSEEADDATRPYRQMQYKAFHDAHKLYKQGQFVDLDQLGAQVDKIEQSAGDAQRAHERDVGYEEASDIAILEAPFEKPVKGPIDAVKWFALRGLNFFQKPLPGESMGGEIKRRKAELVERIGEERANQQIERAKREKLLQFDGDTAVAESGMPLIKPMSAVMLTDGEIKSQLVEQGVPQEVVDNYVEKYVPKARQTVVETIAALKEWTQDENLKNLPDMEFAREVVRRARENGKPTAFLQGVQASLGSLGGSVQAMFGADEAGAKKRKAAQALNILNSEMGEDFIGQLGGTVPDIAMSLIPGAALAKSGKVVNLMGRFTRTAEGAKQATSMLGASVGSGASAGIKTFGDALDQGFGKWDSAKIGLRQFAITAGVTAAFGPTGIESAFAGPTLRKGLGETLKGIFKEATKEGVEEMTDEFIAHFVVQKKLNPDASEDDLVNSTVDAFFLGMAMGGGVSGVREAVGGIIGKPDDAEKAEAAGLPETAEAVAEKQAVDTRISPVEASESSPRVKTPEEAKVPEVELAENEAKQSKAPESAPAADAGEEAADERGEAMDQNEAAEATGEGNAEGVTEQVGVTEEAAVEPQEPVKAEDQAEEPAAAAPDEGASAEAGSNPDFVPNISPEQWASDTSFGELDKTDAYMVGEATKLTNDELLTKVSELPPGASILRYYEKELDRRADAGEINVLGIAAEKARRSASALLAAAGNARAVKLQSTVEPDVTVVVSPSNAGDAEFPYRATRFKKEAPIGHTDFRSFENAIASFAGESADGPPYGVPGEFRVVDKSNETRGSERGISGGVQGIGGTATVATNPNATTRPPGLAEVAPPVQPEFATRIEKAYQQPKQSPPTPQTNEDEGKGQGQGLQVAPAPPDAAATPQVSPEETPAEPATTAEEPAPALVDKREGEDVTPGQPEGEPAGGKTTAADIKVGDQLRINRNLHEVKEVTEKEGRISVKAVGVFEDLSFEPGEEVDVEEGVTNPGPSVDDRARNPMADPAPHGRKIGPGAASDKEWKIHRAWYRFKGLGWFQGDPETTPKYIPFSNPETEEEMREQVRRNGLVAMANVFIEGKLPDGTTVNTGLLPQQEAWLGEVLIQDLIAARDSAQNNGSDEDARHLDDLVYEVQIAQANLGNLAGSILNVMSQNPNPENLVRKADEHLKDSTSKSRDRTESAAKKTRKKAAKNEDKSKKKMLKWLENIDARVKRVTEWAFQKQEGDTVRVGSEERRRPTIESDDIKKIVARYGSGEPMTEEYLLDQFLEAGFTEDEAALGVAKAGLVRKANALKREVDAKLKFIGALKKRQQSLDAARRTASRQHDQAEKFVTSIGEPAPEKARPTSDNNTPTKVLSAYVNGEAMTQQQFEAELRQFKKVDGSPLFTDEQIAEASARAKVARDAVKDASGERAKKEMLLNEAREYADSVASIMSREDFASIYGDRGEFIKELANVRGEISAMRLMAGGRGFTDGQRRNLMNLAAKVRKAPDGFMKHDAQRRLMVEIARTRGVPLTDVAMSLWYSNILSGPNTHAINAFGSGFHTMLRTLAAAVADVGVSVARGESSNRSIRDTGAMIKGFAKALPYAWTEFKGALLDGKQVAKFEKKYNFNAETMEAIDPGLTAKQAHARLVKALRAPFDASSKAGFAEAVKWYAAKSKYITRMLTATDGFFYRTAYEGRAAAAASRLARQNSSSKEEYAQLMAEELHNTSRLMAEARDQAEMDVMNNASNDATSAQINRDVERRTYEIMDQARRNSIREEARRFGLLTSFTQDPEGMLGALSDATNRLLAKAVVPTPWGNFQIIRPLIPFTNIVANVANSSLDFTPVGLIRGIKGAHIVGKFDKSGGFSKEESQEKIAASIVGSGLMGIVYGIAHAFLDEEDPPFAIYSMGPDDYIKRRQWLATGAVPHSIKIGNQFIKYNETPLGMMFSMVGAIHDKKRWDRKWDERSVSYRASVLTSMAARAYSEQGFLRSISDVVDIVVGDATPTRGAAHSLARVLKGGVPLQGMWRDVFARPFDPEVISTEDLHGVLVKDIPWVQGLGTEPMLNHFGQAIKREGAQRVPFISRFVSTEHGDDETMYLIRSKLWLPQPRGEIAVAAPSLPKGKARNIVESREKRMGRFAAAVLTDEEAYELQKRVGPKMQDMVASMMRRYPDIDDSNRERVQRRIDNESQKIRDTERRRMAFEGMLEQ